MRQRDPSDFQEGSFRTIPLNVREGIKAVIGKLNGKSTTTIQTYLFQKAKGWTVQRAEKWIKKNRGRHMTRGWSDQMSGYPGDPDLRVIMAGDTFRLEEPNEWETIRDGVDPVSFETKDDQQEFDHVELDANGVPTAFRIVPFGDWPTSKYGTLKVTELSAKGTMAWYAYKWGKELAPMDWSHKSADGTDERSPGWWRPEIRQDGIWAVDIDWTEDGYEQLRKKEIRFFSPEGKHNSKTGEVLAIQFIALTNRPATNHQRPLVATDTIGGTPADETSTVPPVGATPPKEEVEMKELLKKLGLPETATEAEALAKLDEIAKAVPADVEKTHKEALEAKAAEITAKDKEIATLKAKMDSGDDTDETKALKGFRASTLETLKLGAGADSRDVIRLIAGLQAKAPEAERATKLEAEVA
jgi:hypothetical protein